MSSNYNKLIKLSVKIGLALGIILFVLQKPSTLIEYLELIGSTAGYVAILTLLYEKWLWKFNPLSDTPKLKKFYKGYIKFFRDNKWHKKEIEATIDQTFTKVVVKIITDEMISKSLISDIIFENGGFVLYYTYITNPKSEYSKKNPMQIGSTKMMIEEERLHGSYWTNRQTIGDIYFEEESM